MIRFKTVTDCCGVAELYTVYENSDGTIGYDAWDFCRCCLEPYKAIDSDDYDPDTDFQCNKSHY